MTDHLSHGEKLVEISDVELCVETFGNPANPAILFIDGAAASMLWWEAELCERIARGDRFVIRYDNRDTGRSTSYPAGRPGYTFTDLAGDALGILERPERRTRAHRMPVHVRRNRAHHRGGPPRPGGVTDVRLHLHGRGRTPAVVGRPHQRHPRRPGPRRFRRGSGLCCRIGKACSGGSPYFDETATRALVERDVARTRDIASTLVNHYAMTFDGSSRDFAAIEAPTLVVHGDHDPLVPLPTGRHCAARFPARRC